MEKNSQDEHDTFIPFMPQHKKMWHLHIGGSSNQEGARVGLVNFLHSNGTLTYQGPILEFKASNNEAEYETLIVGSLFAIGKMIDHLLSFLANC